MTAGRTGAGRRRRPPVWLRHLLRRPDGVLGLGVVVLVVVVALVSLVWTPHALLAADASAAWQGPSLRHLLGTDRIGRDVLSWLMAGARTTVVVAAASTLVAALIGLPLAAAGALAPARLSEPLVVLVDILVAFPVLLVAMLLAAPFGGSLAVVVLAVGFGAGVQVARVTRPDIVRVGQSDYVLAARAAGVGAWRRLVDHVLPNVAPVVVVQLSQTAAVATLAEAGLSYLGYGAPSSTASWGRSLADAQPYIGVAPLAVVWPGLAIGLVVLALNLLGDAVRHVSDPRLLGTVPQDVRQGADVDVDADADAEPGSLPAGGAR